MNSFETNGTEHHPEKICIASTYSGKNKKPCLLKNCKHHVSNVKSSQSGITYSIVKKNQLINCLLTKNKKEI